MSLKRRIYGLPAMRLYRELRTARLASRPVETSYGFRFAGNPAYLSPDWEPHERRTISALLPRVAAFIDVGANHGFYTALAAQAGVRTVAIEPEEGNLRFLKSTVTANGYRTEILPLALSDAPGVLNLFGDGDTASVVEGWAGYSNAFRQLVPANTLDNLLSARWSGERLLIKIDVEGAEAQVLAGASTTIARTPRPYWLIETFPHVFGSTEKSAAFLAVFDAMRTYSVFLADEALTPVSPQMVEAWAADPRLQGRGGSNFLFVSPDDAADIPHNG
jgi:FkbM family methyltransferase